MNKSIINLLNKSLALIAIMVILDSVIVVGQNGEDETQNEVSEEKPSPSDYTTWSDKNVNDLDFTQVDRATMNNADPEVVRQISHENAEIYISKNVPLTNPSLNERILLQKVLGENVDVESLPQNFEFGRTNLGDNYIITNTNYGKVTTYFNREGSPVPVSVSEDGFVKIGEYVFKRGKVEIEDSYNLLVTGSFSAVKGDKEIEFTEGPIRYRDVDGTIKNFDKRDSLTILSSNGRCQGGENGICFSTEKEVYTLGRGEFKINDKNPDPNKPVYFDVGVPARLVYQHPEGEVLVKYFGEIRTGELNNRFITRGRLPSNELNLEIKGNGFNRYTGKKETDYFKVGPEEVSKCSAGYINCGSFGKIIKQEPKIQKPLEKEIKPTTTPEKKPAEEEKPCGFLCSLAKIFGETSPSTQKTTTPSTTTSTVPPPIIKPMEDRESVR